MTSTPTPLMDLPSLPILTSIRVLLYIGVPSRCIVQVLSSISSTPALASIDVQCGHPEVGNIIYSEEWDGLDKWLERVAKHTAAEHSLEFAPRRWLFSESSWEALLPRFREAGGKIKIHPDGWIPYDEIIGRSP